ncbi:hypothetical protein [Haloferax elongans]|uniref:hypothetical protein n=1 Tax=Haloferax elongans TaxID=403191 RepID=UPI000A7F851A|nr:hypothetical protein [Haloferax elongans]
MLARRAHEFALSELDVDPGDTGYDSGRTFRTKRRAVSQFRKSRNEYDSNVAGVVASEAASRIHTGDSRLDDSPTWRDRLRSATTFLVAEGMLRNLGDVVEPLEQG